MRFLLVFDGHLERVLEDLDDVGTVGGGDEVERDTELFDVLVLPLGNAVVD